MIDLIEIFRSSREEHRENISPLCVKSVSVSSLTELYDNNDEN